MCDFKGYFEPEMVKKRRVVVVSPIRSFKNRADATTIVVPLSETPPLSVRPWHYAISAQRYDGVKACWAKGDLVAHVGLFRLDRILYRGRWTVPILDGADLMAVRRAVASAVGLPLT